VNVFGFAIPLAYLAGSIPFGLLIARAHKVNIRAHGSGNIGATNVWRTLGKGAGLSCFVLDVLKGFGPTFLAGYAAGLIGTGTIAQTDAWLWLAVAAAAILGHMFPLWLGFKGGKGVATGFGALLGIYPILTWPALGALVVWIIVARISRFVSLASCLAAITLPLWLVLTLMMRHRYADQGPAPFSQDNLPWFVVVSLLAAFILLRHRANIGRLLQGTENRIGQS